MLKTIHLAIVACFAVGLTLFFVVTIHANNNQKGNDPAADLEQSKFMRKKLEASAQILEGLTTEDAELITKGARILAELSSAEKWQVHNDVLYKQFSNEFQRSANALVSAAEKGNFDAAALKWMDTTLKCIECHKFVRGMRLASK